MTANVAPPDHSDRAARAAYLAYGYRVDFKAVSGEPMRLFDDLPDTIRDAWVDAAKAAIRYAFAEGDQEFLRRWVDET